MGEHRPKIDESVWVTQTEFVTQNLPLGALSRPRSPLVHLWYLDLGSLWQALSSALGDDGGSPETAGVDMTMPQLRFARRFYLRMLLGAYLGVAGKDVSLVRGARGKPVLDTARHGEDLHFSLAKSGHRLLIGISGNAEVGVDLELKDRKPRDAPGLARRFFTDLEAESICGLDVGERDAAFMRTWACKEAVAKASGHGIANRFLRFSVNAVGDRMPSVVEDEDHPAGDWQLAFVIPEQGYLATVAIRQPTLQVQAHRLGRG